MYINISYKFHRIPDRQSRFITKVHDLLGKPSYIRMNEEALQMFILFCTYSPCFLCDKRRFIFLLQSRSACFV